MISGNLDDRTLHAALLSLRHIQHLGFESSALGPFQVHSHENSDPVLGVYTTSTRMERDDRISIIELAGEH